MTCFNTSQCKKITTSAQKQIPETESWKRNAIFAKKNRRMIISISITNFFSIRDTAILDFTAESKPKRLRNALPQNLLHFDGDNFINIIGLFGSNAAGKSNFINAVAFCRNLVLNSHLNTENDRLRDVTFKFMTDAPSGFNINFVTGNEEYDYGFTIESGIIKSEELYSIKNKRRTRIFQRTDTDNYVHKRGAVKRPGDIQDKTGPLTLFVSRASTMKHPDAMRVYNFFLKELIVGPDSDSFEASVLKTDNFEKHKSVLLKALAVSDIDITDIRISNMPDNGPAIQTFHRENPSIPFDFFTEESDGTKRLFLILLTLIKHISGGATIFMDEFDLRLHLKLATFLIDLIRDTGKAQMVFTSHNPYLIDRENLRPEQIVFVNKQPDGNTEFTPLSDFVNITEKTDIRKAYLQGRFDAVPYIGPSKDIFDSLSENPA